VNGYLLQDNEISLISIGWKDQEFTTYIIQSVSGIQIELVDKEGNVIQHPNPAYLLISNKGKFHEKFATLSLSIEDGPVLALPMHPMKTLFIW
jgi:hypothetical protein